MTTVLTAGPAKARENEERGNGPVDFRLLTVKAVEEMVGKSATKVEVQGSWVVCTFPGGTGGDITVSFRNWK
jgi:hypothetical protein